MHGLADRVRGFAEIEIEHPMRVGNHGRAPPANYALFAHSLILCESSLSRAERLRRCRYQPAGADAAKCIKLSLALARATGCNSPKTPPSGMLSRRGTVRESRPCTGPSISPEMPSSRPRANEAYSMPLEDFDPGDPELFRTDTFWPYFDRLRKEEPVHYCKDSMFGPYWSVTKYNDIMDVETNHAVFSSAASLGGITIRDVAPDLRRESFIAMDQPRHSRAAQDRGADVHADPSRPARDQHPQALGRMPRQSADQRGVRLGRPGLDRTDHADARDAVRLPLGGPPQADALVRRRHHASRPRRPRRHRGRAAGRADGMRDLFRASSGRSASTSRRRATCSR